MTPADASGLYGDRGQYGDSDEEQPRVVVRDKRRIDPETGAVREPASARPAGSVLGESVTDPAPSAEKGVAQELAERTEDLQRVSAEYANYRRRVDRDRILIGEMAQERLLLDLLPVMDDIDRAREHGDLTGALKSTADQLTVVLDRAGVQAYGEVGDRFDPGIHEAVLHSESDDLSVPTCTHVMRRGYRRGDRVLRAAMVGVADPATPAVTPDPPASTETAASTPDDGATAPAEESPAADERTE